MYKIIYMKADFEPWWQFDGWEEHIEASYEFDTEQAYHEALQKLLADFRHQFTQEECRKERFIAFWNEGDCAYCEGCDEDAQIYHGIILQYPSNTFNLQK